MSVASFLVDGLLGGTILFALTWVFVSIPAIKRRANLVSAAWLVVLLRFLCPINIGGSFSIEASVAELVGSAGWLFPLSSSSEVAMSAPAASASHPASSIAMAAWMAIALFLAAVTLVRYRASREHLRKLPLAPEELVVRARVIATQLGLRRLPAIRIGGRSPAAIGLIHPTIIIPRWVAESAHDHVLAHELAHVRRRDGLWALFVRAAQVALFFWPPVWIASRRFAAAREMACDQLALGATGANERDYARTLVDVSKHLLATRAPALLMAARASELSSRVSSILAPTKGAARRGLGVGGAMVLTAQIVIGLPGSAADASAALPFDDCVVSAESRAKMMTAHPEADRDGDGYLSRDEICAFERQLRELPAAELFSEAQKTPALGTPAMCVEEFRCPADGSPSVP